MSCEEIRRANRYSVCSHPHHPRCGYTTWGRIMSHTSSFRPFSDSGWLAPVYCSPPSWYVHPRHWQGYTEEDWQTITDLALSLLDRAHLIAADLFPSSLLLLAGPMSGVGDPNGTMARRILHRCTHVSIGDTNVPFLARILAHGWTNPAVTDDVIRWCMRIFESFHDHQTSLLAALVVAFGAEVPDVRDCIPDELVEQTIAFGYTMLEKNYNKEAYLPVLRSLVIHLAHRRPVAEWIHRMPQMLIKTIATMGAWYPIPKHVVSLVLRILETSVTPDPDTVDMAAQWLGNPDCRTQAEAVLDRAAEEPSLYSHVLAALARSPYPWGLLRYLSLVEQSLVCHDHGEYDQERDWSEIEDRGLYVLCHWMQDIGNSAFFLDRIVEYTQRMRYPIRLLIPFLAQSYRSLARCAELLDPRVIDTMLDHCRTYYTFGTEKSIAETLGELLENGPPDIANRALHVCRDLITPWNFSCTPLAIALCRGLAGPCAQEAAAMLMSLASHPAAQSDVVHALITVPVSDDNRSYRETVATHVLTTLSQCVDPPPNLRDALTWAVQYLPSATARDILVRFASNQEMDPISRLYSLIGLLAYGSPDHHRDAWTACAGISSRHHFDTVAILDAWLWGISIAPTDSASWLVACSRNHQGLQSILTQDRVSEG